MASDVKYYYVPINEIRCLLDDARGVVGHITQCTYNGLFDKPAKGNVYYQLTQNQLTILKMKAENKELGDLLAFLGFQALKSIVGRKRGEFVQTSNWLMVARMAGYRTWQELKAATNEEMGVTIWKLMDMQPRTFQINCVKIRELVADRYKIVSFQPSPLNRGFMVKIEAYMDDPNTAGGDWIASISKRQDEEHPRKIAPASEFVERL